MAMPQRYASRHLRSWQCGCGQWPHTTTARSARGLFVADANERVATEFLQHGEGLVERGDRE